METTFENEIHEKHEIFPLDHYNSEVVHISAWNKIQMPKTNVLADLSCNGPRETIFEKCN